MFSALVESEERHCRLLVGILADQELQEIGSHSGLIIRLAVFDQAVHVPAHRRVVKGKFEEQESVHCLDNGSNGLCNGNIETTSCSLDGWNGP